MRNVFRMTYVAVAAGLAALTVFAAPAAADHFDTSTKECGVLIGGHVSCTLTIDISDDPADGGGTGLSPGENIDVTLLPGTTGAAYDSASLAGGTCVLGGGAGTPGVTVTPTMLVVTPDVAADLNNCTIIVNEVLHESSAGQVCQVLDSESAAPPVEVCDEIEPGSITAEDCKNGGWMDFGFFKNQGDCVSFVAHRREEPTGRLRHARFETRESRLRAALGPGALRCAYDQGFAVMSKTMKSRIKMSILVTRRMRLMISCVSGSSGPFASIVFASFAAVGRIQKKPTRNVSAQPASAICTQSRSQSQGLWSFVIKPIPNRSTSSDAGV